jgi:hypothetical protein
MRLALPLVMVLAAAFSLLLLLPPSLTLWSKTLGINGTVQTGGVDPPGELTCRFISQFQAELAWSPAAGWAPEGYRIYHDGPFWHDDFELMNQVTTPATTYDEVWPSFFRHRWYVTTFLGPWESGASNVIEVYCRPALSFPGPCALDGENHHSERAVEVTWEPTAGAVLYGVFRAEQSGGPYEMTGTTENTAYEDTAVSDGATYYYVVVAVDAQGNESDPSLEIAVPDSASSDSPTGGPITEPSPTPEATTPTEEPQSFATGTPTPTWMMGPDWEPAEAPTWILRPDREPAEAPTWMIGPGPGPAEEAPSPEPSEEPAVPPAETTATPTPAIDPTSASGSGG